MGHIHLNFTFLTMATINEFAFLQDFSAPSLTSLVASANIEIVDVLKTSDKKRKSWSHLSWPYRWLVKHKWMRTMFCLDDGDLDDIVLEAKIRDSIRNEMKLHIRGCDVNAIKDTIMDVYQTTGYDMSKCSNQIEVDESIKSEEDENEMRELTSRYLRLCNSEADAGLTISVPEPLSVSEIVSLSGSVGSDDNTVPGVSQKREAAGDQRRVKVIPRFVAALTFALRAKFGRLACTEANRLLIEREYLRVCRDSCVRHVDVAHHHQFVINTYFNEGLTDEIATVRVRLPRWLRAAFGRKPMAAPVVC